MHKFINVGEIPVKATSDPNCEVIICCGAWNDHFMTHYFNNIQQNHRLCLDKVTGRYEYVFLTTEGDYNKYKNQFTTPDITFIFFPPSSRIMGSIHMEYCYYRKKPMISLAADCLHTSNIVSSILDEYSKVYDAISITSQRLYPQVMNAIREKESQMPYEDIFKPRELLKTVFPYLYATERCYMMDDYKPGTLNGFFWPVRKDGVLIGELMRAFHHGVVYVKYPKLGMEQSHHCWGLDSNPFLSKLTTPEKMGVISDSDDGFCCGIEMDSNIGWLTNTLPTIPKFDNIKQRLIDYWHTFDNDRGVSKVNEAEMGFKIALHSEPLDQSWIDLAKQTDDFITDIYGGAIKNKELYWRMLT